jgi:hypothetical protein
MIVNRSTFNIKRGRMEEAKALLKEALQWWPADTGAVRHYASHFGTLNQLAMEGEFQSLADCDRAWTEWGAKMPPDWARRWNDAAETGGSNEIWTILE